MQVRACHARQAVICSCLCYVPESCRVGICGGLTAKEVACDMCVPPAARVHVHVDRKTGRQRQRDGRQGRGGTCLLATEC